MNVKSDSQKMSARHGRVTKPAPRESNGMGDDLFLRMHVRLNATKVRFKMQGVFLVLGKRNRF